jgi:hypothetical protein
LACSAGKLLNASVPTTAFKKITVEEISMNRHQGRMNLLIAGTFLCSGCSLETAPSTDIRLGKNPSVYSGSKDLSPDDEDTIEPSIPVLSDDGKTGRVETGKDIFLANIKSAVILKALQDDVLKLNPSEQIKTRYFTLHTPSNAGKGSSTLDVQRKAFKKTLNSLSTKSSLVKPVALDADKIVYRVNLDDINISPEKFDQVIAEHYPFANSFEDIGSAESISNQQIDLTLKKLLKTNIYIIRMDWFNATAPLPVLYSKFLDYPNNLSDFEEGILGKRVSVASITASSADQAKKLDPSVFIREGGVNKVDRRIANIVQDQVLRTGFDNSNVSFSNRVVERHPIASGSYWISYDFFNLKAGDSFVNADGITKNADQKDLDQHNINKTPLGPKGTNGKSLEFNHDGGEVIYSLPNGMFGYYLINAKGDLLDKGPINVVRQNSAPPEFSLAITNGMSCMSCHNAGLLKQADSILTGIGQNKQLLTQTDLSRINKVYNPNELNRIMDRENDRYFKALAELGIDPTKPDPIDQAFRFYNRPLNKKDVIAELEMSERDFTLLLLDPDFSGTFNALNNDTGFVNRGVFQAIYPSVVLKFKQEQQLAAPKEADFVVTVDCMAVDLVQMDNCIINPLQLNLQALR